MRARAAPFGDSSLDFAHECVNVHPDALAADRRLYSGSIVAVDLRDLGERNEVGGLARIDGHEVALGCDTSILVSQPERRRRRPAEAPPPARGRAGAMPPPPPRQGPDRAQQWER
jgi:hypothetical protein